jgi:hypothetical protein
LKSLTCGPRGQSAHCPSPSPESQNLIPSFAPSLSSLPRRPPRRSRAGSAAAEHQPSSDPTPLPTARPCPWRARCGGEPPCIPAAGARPAKRRHSSPRALLPLLNPLPHVSSWALRPTPPPPARGLPSSPTPERRRRHRGFLSDGARGRRRPWGGTEAA